MSYKKLGLSAPNDIQRKTKLFLERNHFVSRAVTHIAADLNPDHIALMKEMLKILWAFMKVCNQCF